MNKLLIMAVLLLLGSVIYCIVLITKQNLSDLTLCTSYVDVIIQLGIFIMLVVFTVLSYFISKRINEL